MNKSQKEFGFNGNKRYFNKPYIRLYNRLLNGAKSKGLIVTLSYLEFLEFTKIGSCIYCNTEVQWVKHGKKAIKYNLDRKINSLGYTKDNCVVCCWKCNSTKSNHYTYEEFIDMTQIFRNRKELKNQWNVTMPDSHFYQLKRFEDSDFLY